MNSWNELTRKFLRTCVSQHDSITSRSDFNAPPYNIPLGPVSGSILLGRPNFKTFISLLLVRTGKLKMGRAMVVGATILSLVFVLAAFILLLLVSLSEPIIKTIYLFQLVNRPKGLVRHFGIWGECVEVITGR